MGVEREEVGGKGGFLDVGQGALSLEGGGEVAVVVSVGCPGRKGEERGSWSVGGWYEWNSSQERNIPSTRFFSPPPTLDRAGQMGRGNLEARGLWTAGPGKRASLKHAGGVVASNPGKDFSVFCNLTALGRLAGHLEK